MPFPSSRRRLRLAGLSAGLCLAFLSLSLASPAQEAQQGKKESDSPPPGERVKLTLGQLFVPQGYVSQDGKVPLTLHLHGSPRILEEEFARARARGVLITVSLNGLSGVYKEKFPDGRTLDGILREAAEKLTALKVAEKPVIGQLTVSSFSAGFGGVREMLRDDRAYDRIDSLILADSLYCGYAEGISPPQVDPKLMEGFLRFAKDAAAGKKTLMVSHCQLKPDGYASTAETADYLLANLGLKRTIEDEEWIKGAWRCTSRCRLKGFHLAGFEGDQGKDHMKHLININKLYEEAGKKE